MRMRIEATTCGWEFQVSKRSALTCSSSAAMEAVAPPSEWPVKTIYTYRNRKAED
jgi:hypothetical protein